MVDPIGQHDASAELARVRAAQDAVISRAIVPPWYWWAVALLSVALGVIVDTGVPVAVAVGAVLFAVVVAGLTAWAILGGGRVQVSRELLGGDGALRIIGFVGVVVGVSLAVGFALRAGGAPDPATIATLVTAVGLVVGGPWLMRGLRQSMLRHREAR